MTPLAYVFISNVADRLLLCLLGFIISCYSLYVEVQHEKNPHYVAACDFNEHMSCSKVLTSRYASAGLEFALRSLYRLHIGF